MKNPLFKKYLITSFVFLILALCAGVYFREFTKFFNQDNTYTVLGLAHPHLLMLGFGGSLLIGTFNTKLELEGKQAVKYLTYTYFGAVGLASMMLIVRGTLNVLIASETINELSNGMNAMISGISGLAHIVLAISLVTLFVFYIKSYSKTNIENK